MKSVTALVDDLLERLSNQSYQASYGVTEVLSSYDKNRTNAARTCILGWVNDNFVNQISEIETLKAKVFVLEEMIKKSTFAPMLQPTSVSQNTIMNGCQPIIATAAVTPSEE